MNSFWADPIGFVILWFISLLQGWGLPGDLVLLISYVVGALPPGDGLAAPGHFFDLGGAENRWEGARSPGS